MFFLLLPTQSIISIKIKINQVRLDLARKNKALHFR